MSKLVIDFRFVEIDYELWALGEYLDMLEQQLPVLRNQAREQTYAQLRDEEVEADDPEVDFAFQELDELVERVLPRFFRNPFLVTLWAIYESAIIGIADYLKEQQGQALGIQDIRGGFLDRARKYFDYVLELPLCTDAQVWQRLRMMMVLRNAIAHGNGRIAAINKGSQKKIESWAQGNIDISIPHGNLTISEHFLRETYTIVNESLNDLLHRVRSMH